MRLEFWETLDSFMFCVLSVAWKLGSSESRRMPRLYLQRGLSTRVVQAVAQRLERILEMASDGAFRTRSRSPVRGSEGVDTRDLGDATDATMNVGLPNQPEGTLPEGTVDMPEGAPGLNDMAAAPPEVGLVDPTPSEPEIWKQTLEKVLVKLQSTSFDLSASIDASVDHQDKLKAELSALAKKIDAQSSALTTVGASLATEVVEINKLLRAFDKFAQLFRWTFSGKNSFETNMAILQQTVIDQRVEFETSMVTALTKMSTILEKIAENTMRSEARPSEAAMFPPSAPETPGPLGGVPAFPLPNHPPPPPGTAAGSPGTASVNPGTASVNPGTAAVNPGKAVVNPPKAAGAGAERVPLSLFMAFCPEVSGGQRPSAPTGEETPCPRPGIFTRDAGTHQPRTLSPTGYRANEVSAMTSLWAPKGLGCIRDGQQLLRRIY